jgi:hypothetical protein
MSNAVLNTFKKMILKGDVLALSDTFKIALMQIGFVFDITTHLAYANVSGSELATAFGYTAGGETLTGVALTVDNTNNLAKLSWSNVQWNAAGGSIVCSGAVIYDDTTSTGSGHDYTKAIVAYIDARGTMIASDGTPLIAQNIKVEIR